MASTHHTYYFNRSFCWAKTIFMEEWFLSAASSAFSCFCHRYLFNELCASLPWAAEQICMNFEIRFRRYCWWASGGGVVIDAGSIVCVQLFHADFNGIHLCHLCSLIFKTDRRSSEICLVLFISWHDWHESHWKYVFCHGVESFKKRKKFTCVTHTQTHTRWYHFRIDVPGQHVIRLNIRHRQLDSTN